MTEKDAVASDVSRRDVIKKAIKVGGAAYVAPAVLMALQPASALAAVTGPSGPTQPCNQSTISGGQGVTTTNHELGRTSGTFMFSYDALTIPDRFDVYYQGAIIFTTGGPVSGSASRSISYSGSATFITVIVTGPQSGTAWSYMVGCPT